MSSSDPSDAPAPQGGRRRRAGSAGDASEGGSGRRASGTRRRGSGGRRKTVPILLGVLGAAVVALAVVLVVQFASGPSAPENARPSSYTVVHESDRMGAVLASQETDSRPLAEGEMFERGNEAIDSQDIEFELADHELTEDCSAAVWGEAVAGALEDGGCTQAARAAYSSGDYVGAAVLFNLRDAKAAKAVADAMEQPKDVEAEGPGFITNPGSEDPLTRLGAGYSRAEASVNGHYLLVAWAQSAGSDDPAEHEDLTSPLIALTSFKDPLYRRVVELEAAADVQGGGAGSGQGGGAGAGQEGGAGAGAGQEGGAGAGTGQESGAGADQGTGGGAGTPAG